MFSVQERICARPIPFVPAIRASATKMREDKGKGEKARLRIVLITHYCVCIGESSVIKQDREWSVSQKPVREHDAESGSGMLAHKPKNTKKVTEGVYNSPPTAQLDILGASQNTEGNGRVCHLHEPDMPYKPDRSLDHRK